MLVIARKVGQTILIGDNIEITIAAVRGDQVRLAIQAPREVSVVRQEVAEQVGKGNQAALETADTDLLAALQRALTPADGVAEPAPGAGKVTLGRQSGGIRIGAPAAEPAAGPAEDSVEEPV